MSGGVSKAPDVPVGATESGTGIYPWYVVFIGMLVSLIAVLDRQVVALLVEPIKGDLELSDVQFSLLTGTAFSLSYALAGLPMGALVDRMSRVKILAGGLFVWSMATVLACTARSFGFLFATRAVVGAGESVLQPATKSLITDLFYGKHLAKAIAIVALGSSIGSGLALVIGGAILGSLSDVEHVAVPIFGDLRPWQFVFLCMGLPGVLLAPVLLFTVREPKRRRVLVKDDGVAVEASYRELLRFTIAHRRSVLSVMIGYAVYALAFQGVIAWAPAFFMRQHGMTAAEVGATLGPAQLAISIAMMLISGWWIDRRIARGTPDAPIRWSIGSAIVGLIPLLLFPHMPTPELALAMLVLGIIGTTGYVVASIPLMQLMPSQLRGKAMVTYQLVSNLIAGMLGPFLVALLTDNVFGSPKAVGYSLSIVAGGAVIVAIAILWSSLRSYHASMADLAERTR